MKVHEGHHGLEIKPLTLIREFLADLGQPSLVCQASVDSGEISPLVLALLVSKQNHKMIRCKK